MIRRKREPRGVELATALLVLSCAGRSLDHKETDTNTNWLERCPEGDVDCQPFDRRGPAHGIETEIAPPRPELPRESSELSTVDSCIVRCDAVLSGDECRGTARIPSLGETVVTWQGMDCAGGSLLQGNCAGGTRFVWRGGDTTEVRYFGADGSFIGLSSFLSSPDPSTCNGVRRWPQQIACDAPVVTRELCGDRTSGFGETSIDASDWLEHLNDEIQ